MVEDPEVPPNKCFPGKEEVANLVAEITGKKMASLANMVAKVRCSKIEGEVKEKFQYIGYSTCSSAHLAFGGPMMCSYACIGFGDCASVCPFNAITMVDRFPVINSDVCVGCGSCVRACPKGVIELILREARVWVPCSTKDPGKKVKEVCKVGCISCKMCVKACPAKAVKLEDGIIRIDHEKCLAYGQDCGEICVEKCPRNIFRHYSSKDEYKEREKEAA